MSGQFQCRSTDNGLLKEYVGLWMDFTILTPPSVTFYLSVWLVLLNLGSTLESFGSGSFCLIPKECSAVVLSYRNIPFQSTTPKKLNLGGKLKSWLNNTICPFLFVVRTFLHHLNLVPQSQLISWDQTCSKKFGVNSRLSPFPAWRGTRGNGFPCQRTGLDGILGRNLWGGCSGTVVFCFWVSQKSTGISCTRKSNAFVGGIK